MLAWKTFSYGSDWATDFNVEKGLLVILTPAIERKLKTQWVMKKSKYPNTIVKLVVIFEINYHNQQ